MSIVIDNDNDANTKNDKHNYNDISESRSSRVNVFDGHLVDPLLGLNAVIVVAIVIVVIIAVVFVFVIDIGLVIGTVMGMVIGLAFAGRPGGRRRLSLYHSR